MLAVRSWIAILDRNPAQCRSGASTVTSLTNSIPWSTALAWSVPAAPPAMAEVWLIFNFREVCQRSAASLTVIFFSFRSDTFCAF